MRYVRINDRDYVLVRNDATAQRIIRAWLFTKYKPTTDAEVARWQLLRLNANGTASILGADDRPESYADFDIIEIGDAA